MPKNEVEIIRFGVDTVRFNFSEKFYGAFFEALFSGMSLNSNQKNNVNFFGSLVDVYFSETAAKKILQIHYCGDAIMCIEKILDSGAARSLSYTVTFYAAYFYISSLKFLLPDFVRRYGHNMTVSRCDLALDVLCTVGKLWRSHKTKAQKKNVWKKGRKIETFYLGSKTGNKRHFIRVYDKKLDSRKKGKFHLFMSYLEQKKPVSRIEAQLNVISCNEFTLLPEHFLKTEGMEGKLWSVFQYVCMNESATSFSIVPIPLVKSVHTLKKQTVFSLDKVPYARTMLGYARRLKEYGFDPIEYLRINLESVPAVQKHADSDAEEEGQE